jgi:hypothetical protein
MWWSRPRAAWWVHCHGSPLSNLDSCAIHRVHSPCSPVLSLDSCVMHRVSGGDNTIAVAAVKGRMVGAMPLFAVEVLLCWGLARWQ